MIDRIRHINIEGLSFWIGFTAATIFWWLMGRLRPYFKKAVLGIKDSFSAARQSMQTGAEQRLRASTLKSVQSLHLASPLFSLDEIVIPPRLMAPPVNIIPGEEPPLDYVTENVIPFMPEFPELAGAFNGHTIPAEKILSGGANIVITGRHGSGKTTTLAYLASLLARRDDSLGELKEHLPVFLHANEFTLPIETEEQPILAPIITALTERSSSLGKTRLPEALESAFRDGRALLMLDGFDEIDNETAQHISNYLEQVFQEYPQVRIIAAADPQFVDGLLHLGLAPVPMAFWSRRQQAQFIQRWSSLWERFVQEPVHEEDEENEITRRIDPVLLNGWLLNDNAALNPLEFTLKVWAAYAGDARGPRGTDAIEAYLRRMSVGVHKARPALEYIASQMTLSRRSSFTQKEAQNWTATFDTAAVEGAGIAMISETENYQGQEITIPRVLSDLTRNGLLISRPGNRLEIIHPQIAAYLAGSALAFSGQGAVLLTQETWPLQESAIHYLASNSDLSEEVSRLLTNMEDPLYRGVLTAGRWLRDIPTDAAWRKPILQHLANLLQRDALPISFRGRVLACLATANDPGVGTMFRHLLRSPKDDVVQLAALGCGFLRDTQAVGHLANQAGHPTRGGQAACLALVNIDTQPAIEAAAAILLNGEENLRRAVAEAFAFHPEEGHPILREGSTLDDLLVRRSVIHGLRLVEDPWALQILEEMQIEDGQWVVRNAAAQAVEELHNLDPYIPRPLKSPENLEWLIEFASEREMGVAPGDPAREMMLSVLMEGKPEQIYAALDYYRRTGDPAIFPAVYHLLYGGDLEIAEAAYLTIWQVAATGAEIPSPAQYGLGY